MQTKQCSMMWGFSVALLCLVGCTENAGQPRGAAGGAGQEEWPIRLRAGVALPQTLPTGMEIGFSVDYKFRKEAADPAGEYIWEIKTADNKIHSIPVKLKGRKGTLGRFLPLRTSSAPFSSRIVLVIAADGPTEPQADWVSMR